MKVQVDVSAGGRRLSDGVLSRTDAADAPLHVVVPVSSPALDSAVDLEDDMVAIERYLCDLDFVAEPRRRAQGHRRVLPLFLVVSAVGVEFEWFFRAGQQHFGGGVLG